MVVGAQGQPTSSLRPGPPSPQLPGITSGQRQPEEGGKHWTPAPGDWTEVVGGETGEGGAWCQEGPEGVRADGVFTRGPKARRVGEQRAKKGLGEWMEASGLGSLQLRFCSSDRLKRLLSQRKMGGCGMQTQSSFTEVWGAPRCREVGGGLRAGLKGRLEVARS